MRPIHQISNDILRVGSIVRAYADLTEKRWFFTDMVEKLEELQRELELVTKYEEQEEEEQEDGDGDGDEGEDGEKEDDPGGSLEGVLRV